MAARILPGGTCGGRPCWRAAGALGYAYANKLATPQGIVKVRLKAGPAGRAQVKVQAKGQDLATPAPPLALPVTVQLLVADGAGTECWQTVYSVAPGNLPGVFKAKGP
jgi:hypothetical protein